MAHTWKAWAPWTLLVLAVAAGAGFTGVPWARSELAIKRVAAVEGRLLVAEQRIASLERGEVGQVPQVLRYEAHGDLVDIVVETMMWPGESHQAWVARQNAAWDAVGVRPPGPPAGGK